MMPGGGGFAGNGNLPHPPPQMMNRRPGGGPPMSGHVWYPAHSNQMQPHDGYGGHQQGPNGPGPMRIHQQPRPNIPVRPNIAPYPPGGMQMRPVGQQQPPPQQQGGFHPQHQQPFNQNGQQVRRMSSSTNMVVVRTSIHHQPQGQGPNPMHQPQMQQQQQPPPQQQIPMGMPGPSMHQQLTSVVNMPVNASAGALIDKVRLDDLVKQIDPSTVLEDNVKDALVELADEFVQEVIDKVCLLVQHRGNNKLEVRDVELVLNMVFNMPSVPRAAVHVFGLPATVVPKLDGNPPTDAHKQRMLLIKKQLKKV